MLTPRVLVALAFAGAVSASIVVACSDAQHPPVMLNGTGGDDGGSSADGGVNGGDGGGGGGDGAVGVNRCPVAVPEEKTACSDLGRQCEYGGNPDTYCNRTATCGQIAVDAGVWSLAGPLPSPRCPSVQGANCPSGPTAVANNSECPSPQMCVYPDGACYCLKRQFGTVDSGPATGNGWSCTPEPTCPWPRPMVGSGCAPRKTTCRYGDLVLICQPDGAWSAIGNPPF